MLRLTLIIVLIAAICSAKHVKKVKRTQDVEENCWAESHPFVQCSILASRPDGYPVFRELTQARNMTESKRVLLAEGNLERICSEARTHLNCMIEALESSSVKCKEVYESQQMTEELFDNAVSFLNDICDDEVLEAIRRNLDCAWNLEVHSKVYKCIYPNSEKDCSKLGPEASHTDFYECFEEKHRRNCDADDIVSCASEAVANECDDDEAGQLVELLGNSYFDKFPACPDNRHLKSLLKFFK
jgi:hypothetical protein